MPAVVPVADKTGVEGVEPVAPDIHRLLALELRDDVPFAATDAELDMPPLMHRAADAPLEEGVPATGDPWAVDAPLGFAGLAAAPLERELE